MFIRGAVKYLTALSEKIIDPNSDEASLSEVILITNYRICIDSALSLVQSW